LYAGTGNDSIYVTQLTVKQPTAATDVQTHWDAYTWLNGSTYTSGNNTATRTLVNAAGCDSVITLNLTILNSAARTVLNPQAICAGGSYAFNGNVYTTAGTYRDTLYAGTGNDSIYVTQLTVKQPTASTDMQTHWDTYTWLNGITYSTSNTIATRTLVNDAGCDSVITLNLTILNSAARTVSNPQAICAGGSYALNGNVYTTAGTYRDTLYVGTGNDSIYVTQLTIKQTTAATDVQTHWDAYTWLNGTTYTSGNTTATRTLVNAAGCDSVITLNLTILNSAARTVSNPQAICAGSSYSLNGNVYTTAGTYRDTLYAGTGNDSIYVTLLTVNPKPVTSAISGQNNPGLGSTETYSVTNTSGSTYNWIITYGTQVSGGNTNSISVLWSNTIIAAAVKVIETNSNGCVGDTITQNVALPVNLLTFTAQKKAKVVELNWRTSSENNNKGFDVERSFDATTFEKLGFVNGNGTTNQISNYNFNDVTYNRMGMNGSTVPSVIYYRLKQLDFNGRFEYSPVVAVNNQTTAQQAVVMNASPNPFQAGFELNINSKKETEATVEIFDAFGKRVANKTVHLVQGETFFSFEQASEWKAGMYFIVLWVDDERQTLRIVRE
jgi:riboflavin synthase